MNTLQSTRSVNTFQNNNNNNNNNINNTEALSPSESNEVPIARPSSMYLSHHHDGDVESRSLLLPNMTPRSERRAQTLGRPVRPYSTGARNATNPLFDSNGSLEKPWYRSYGHATNVTPFKLNVPVRPELTGFATARDTPICNMRMQLSRSPAHMSAYSMNGQRMDDGSVRQGFSTTRNIRPPSSGLSCPSCVCCEKEQNPYSSPEDIEASEGWIKSEEKQLTKPWMVCFLTVGTIFDILLLITLMIIIFYLNCSNDGWIYTDRRIYSMCTTLWSNWIPLHRRTFRCPAVPPGYKKTDGSLTNRQGLNYPSDGRRPNPAYHPQRPGDPYGRTDPKGLENRLATVDPLPEASIWDADIGLMPPPSLHPQPFDSLHQQTTTRLYSPHYEEGEYYSSTSWFGSKPEWKRPNPNSPYTAVSTNAIILSCLLIPVVIICGIELASACLACCRPYGNVAHRFGQISRMIGRIYRTCVTYIFGILLTVLVVHILKASVGRLRPNFITTCRPIYTVCPEWYNILHAAGFRFDYHTNEANQPDPQLLKFIAEESNKHGYVLVPKTTPVSPASGRQIDMDTDRLSDRDCNEKNVLRMKYARTSFPSMSATVTMYASIFLSAYITYSLRYLQRTCFCIPVVLVLGSLLANIFFGLGRIVLRENWLEDVLAGWLLGAIIAGYMVYRIISSRGLNPDASNNDLRKQLNHLQTMLQANQDYRQNDMKYMKYF